MHGKNMELWEILTSTAVIDWEHKGNFELGEFTVDDRRFVIQIERKNPPGAFDPSSRFAEVSFWSHGVDGDDAFKSDGRFTSPARVYGIVANALIDRFSDYDAFYFSAERRHSEDVKEFEARTGIYNWAAERISKRIGADYLENRGITANEFVVSRKRVSMPGFSNPAKEALQEFTNRNVT